MAQKCRLFLVPRDMVEVLKRKIKICPIAENIQLGVTGEKWFPSNRYELLQQVGKESLSEVLLNVCISDILENGIAKVFQLICLVQKESF